MDKDRIASPDIFDDISSRYGLTCVANKIMQYMKLFDTESNFLISFRYLSASQIDRDIFIFDDIVG